MSAYATTDPRSRLASQPAATSPEHVPAAEYVLFHEIAPAQRGENSSTWYARGQNFVLAYTEATADWRGERRGQPDEYVLLLPDRATRTQITANGQVAEVDGFSVVVIPPGDSRIEVAGGGRVIRLFTVRSADLAALAVNTGSYQEAHPTVAPFGPWSASPAGYAIRPYSLEIPRQEGRFGRIFRCSTFMVNYLEPTIGPRDTSKMSPHTHDDFEQCSLALSGSYVHHIRWPWTVDMAHWRPDDHERCPAPSMTVIPPPTIHTSQAVATGINQLVDIFCPPRMDFSQQPGWVLNHDDYPMP